MNVLNVVNLKKSFKDDMSFTRRKVLHGVTLDACAGEILGFLGPNGAGKTTTIKIILGLVKADSGSVTMFGKAVSERSVMARIGFLPENPYFYPHLSLLEFLQFCGRMSGMTGSALLSRIEEVTHRVGLDGNSTVRLNRFSKGMLQRAGLAQAILHDPELLIFDEPFSGLDPLGRIMVRDIMVDLRKRGKTIFFSSHILPDVETLCDRTCIIREGRIVRCVGLDDLIRIGESWVEVTARGCTPDCIDALADYIGSKSATGEEYFLVVKRQEYVRTVLQHIYNSGGEVLRVANRHLSLEEVFLKEIMHDGGKREREREPEQESAFIGF